MSELKECHKKNFVTCDGSLLVVEFEEWRRDSSEIQRTNIDCPGRRWHCSTVMTFHHGLVSWTTASPPVLLIIQERQDQSLPSTEIQLSYTLGQFYSNRCVQITWINSITDTTTTIPPLPPPSRSLVNPPISLITNVPRINHSRPCVGIQGTNFSALLLLVVALNPAASLINLIRLARQYCCLRRIHGMTFLRQLNSVQP